MPHVSITRLRVRPIRYLPEFLLRALASVRQSRNSPGCLCADVRREVKLIFWTRTFWHDEKSMRAFMTTGAHRAVMPKILDWFDEASVTHWQQDPESPPTGPRQRAKCGLRGAFLGCEIPLPFIAAAKPFRLKCEAQE